MKYNISKNSFVESIKTGILAILILSFTLSGAAEGEEAIFNVQMVDTNAPVEEGDELWIDAEITNDGDGSDTQQIIMAVEGEQKDSTELSFSSAGESKVERFSWQTEEGDEGEHSVEIYSEDNSDATTVAVEQGESDCSNEILADILEDTEGGTDEIYLEWDTTNMYCETATYEQSEIQLEDEAGNIVTQTVDDVSGESGGEDFTLRSDYSFGEVELDGLETGEVTINVEAIWDLGSGEDTVSVNFESLDDGDDTEESDESISGSASISIIEPDGVYDIDENLMVEWSATNDFDDGVELIESKIELKDSVGRSTSQEKDIGRLVSERDSETLSVTFDSRDYSSFDEGEWTVTIEDVWAEDTSTASATFTMEETVDEDDDDYNEDDGAETTDDGSNGDDTEDSDQETIDDDSGEGTTDEESSVDSEDSNEETTGNSETSTEENEDGRCPEGFVWDSEAEVCIEDTGTEHTDGNSADQEDIDESTESIEEDGVMQSLAIGPDVRGVPLWMPLTALLVLAVLFKRSSYELEY